MNLEKMKAAVARRSTYTPSDMPRELAAVPEARILDLDVRDDLRQGREPFGRIMQAQSAIGPGGVLRLRAIFDPVPLYTVLGRQGFTHWTEKLADDDWRVWFYRGRLTQPGPIENRDEPQAAAGSSGDDVVVLDVRGLEPPEPMQRTLEALEQLSSGQALMQINARIPQFLLPVLDERGFEYVLVSEQPNEVRGLIRRKVAKTEKVLDVRVIPPREKHPAIFATFDALAAGDAFILVNDHDPLPLRYQFAAERKDRFSWDYVEQGPVLWRVRIGKVA